MKKAILTILLCAVLGVSSAWAAVSEQRQVTEDMLNSLKDHCEGLTSERRTASNNDRWREVLNLSKRYADACRMADDKFSLSLAIEDMGWAAYQLEDYRLGLSYLQQCIDANPYAGGCHVRKVQILVDLGRRREASAAAWRGLGRTERGIALAKQQMAALRKPDPRAEHYWRNRYLRKREELDNRISSLERSRSQLEDLSEELDE